MEILIIGITYNSDEALSDYLDSIETALQHCNDVVVDFVVGDNGDKPFHLKHQKYSFSISIQKFDNIGYLGAAQKILKNTEITSYDYVIISNVDLLLAPNFLKTLSQIKVNQNIGWITPFIWSKYEKRNRNPFLTKRNSKFKLKILRMMYKFPIFHKLYTHSFYKRKAHISNRNIDDNCSSIIYAGHGSIFIFTKEFIEKTRDYFNYPIFLYGEECFAAELCLANDLQVLYLPKLKVESIDHVSTGQMKSKAYYQCNHDAMDYILKNFY